MGANRSPRGEDQHHPHRENTRASFLAAHAAGADWVELDLLPSADGDLMIHHDHFIDVDGAMLPLWQVPTQCLLDLGVEPLDGLDQDLPPQLGLYLELKGAPGDVDPLSGPDSTGPLAEWAQTVVAHRPILAASFDPYAATILRNAGLPAGWITGPLPSLLSTITATIRAELQQVILHASRLDSPAHETDLALDLAHRHGLSVWCWDGAPTRLPHYRDLGITGFCVDDVPGARAALREATIS